MGSVLIRIVLRYSAAFFVARGMMSPGVSDFVSSDPDLMAAIEIGIGALLALAAELWYYAARHFGWST